jgi:hypothetical protein
MRKSLTRPKFFVVLIDLMGSFKDSLKTFFDTVIMILKGTN